MRKPRVLIFIVAYNAERFIEGVLDRIPDEIWCSPHFDTEILIIDDESTDLTFHRAEDYTHRNSKSNLTVLFNPKNLGYGGNQKLGYHYAIDKGFDVVVLLHGDGQYPPEYLDQMVLPILRGEADAVLGSRMIRRLDALKGKMPFYKWIGNQVLTFLQNKTLNANLSEFHTGYRAYSVPALGSIPFEYNSDYFDFDTDILIQLLHTKKSIKEVPIPTFYGDEISRVNGIIYAYRILRTSILSRIINWGIFYHPKFDYDKANASYTLKLGYPSSHQFALDRVAPGSVVLDIGCGPGLMASELSQKEVKTISIDAHVNTKVRKYSYQAIETDIEDYGFNSLAKVDTVLALDVIEHLKSPESFLRNLRSRYCQDAPDVIITTANIGFLPIRLGLLLGQFNYGKKGVLDLTHTRLLTFSHFRRIMNHCGYDILEERGLPAPFPLALGNNWISRFLLYTNSFLIGLSKGLFSYQIAAVVRPRPTLNLLLQRAHEGRDEKLCRNLQDEESKMTTVLH